MVRAIAELALLAVAQGECRGEGAWEQAYRLNLYPTFNATRAVLPRMVERRDGSMVSISSDAGFGEFRPLVPNDTREHRALNRRVEIHLLSSVWDDVAAPVPIPVKATTEHLEP